MRLTNRKPVGPGRLARRLGRDRSGAAALEFALVATPFFLLLFAIIELGVIFVIDTVLDGAVSQTGRMVRTGQVQNAGMSREEFRTSVCGRMSIFSGQCMEQLSVDVRVLPRFKNETPPDPMSGGTFDEGALRFDTGAAGQIVLVSAWYRQSLMTPLMSQALSRLNDGKVVLTATTAFRNEPFGPPNPVGTP